MIDRDWIIPHVMQTEPFNCWSACLSMVSNIHIDQVTNEFHGSYISGELEPQEYLDRYGISYRKCFANERTTKPDHTYILYVPSLNIRGGLHMVVAQVFEEGWHIHDPNLGRDGRANYSTLADDTDYGSLSGWIPVFEFPTADIWKRHVTQAEAA